MQSYIEFRTSNDNIKLLCHFSKKRWFLYNTDQYKRTKIFNIDSPVVPLRSIGPQIFVEISVIIYFEDCQLIGLTQPNLALGLPAGHQAQHRRLYCFGLVDTALLASTGETKSRVDSGWDCTFKGIIYIIYVQKLLPLYSVQFSIIPKKKSFIQLKFYFVFKIINIMTWRSRHYVFIRLWGIRILLHRKERKI